MNIPTTVFPALIPSFPPLKSETAQPLTETAIRRIEFPIIPSAFSSIDEKALSKKQPRKKVVTKTDEWISLPAEYFTAESQRALLMDILYERNPESTATHILVDHIKTKLSGYKSQDITKSKYAEGSFIKLDETIALLVQSELKCYYCRENVKLFYEYVRDPKQWSLERMNNELGHNGDNLVIACLTCNIRRRTMHQERYVATKQMRVRKLPGDDDL